MLKKAFTHRFKCSYIQSDLKLEVQTLRGDRAHRKDSEMHWDSRTQTSF